MAILSLEIQTKGIRDQVIDDEDLERSAESHSPEFRVWNTMLHDKAEAVRRNKQPLRPESFIYDQEAKMPSNLCGND